MNGNKPPTHNLCVQIDGQGSWHQIGVAWKYEDSGNLAIKFHPLVDLSRLTPTDKVRAFSRDRRQYHGGFASGRDSVDYGDDDIPF